MTAHSPGGGAGLLLVLLLAFGYELTALHAPGWSRWRAASFLTGCVVLLIGLALPAHSMTDHMRGHLLIAMIAPLGLILGAPVTLLLRTLPVPTARRLTRLLRSGPARFMAHPVTALVLVIGGLPLLALPAAHAHPLVLAHFLLAGCLFAWVIAGADPAPHRPTVPVRLVILGVAIAAHAIFAQILYATAPGDDQRTAATLMYYGGDLAELLLAFAVVQSRTPRRSAHAPFEVRVTGRSAETIPSPLSRAS
ncbi:cytochrome c oxidase assembly protein [Actinoplanes aureus]|uniref:cytochrome c oxidase assembly protein n=1 Tax=Actinoplanes aureus TaxID=2792083 RepID=UPI002816016B|nr:cytochrome c oxidase assembly protein [Actinoplanes aureus]